MYFHERLYKFLLDNPKYIDYLEYLYPQIKNLNWFDNEKVSSSIKETQKELTQENIEKYNINFPKEYALGVVFEEEVGIGEVWKHLFDQMSDEEIKRMYIISHHDEDKIYFVKSLSIARDQFVYLGERESDGKEFVIKGSWEGMFGGMIYDDVWNPKGSQTRNLSSIMNEIFNYQMLQEVGCDIPEIYFDWSLGLSRVLVMEKLYPLDETDSPIDVGLQILNQLRCVHTVGVHQDIKPDNILKRVNDYGSIDYILVDYGLSINAPYKNDMSERFNIPIPSTYYERTAATPFYHSNFSKRVSEAPPATFKTDLIELAISLYGFVLETQHPQLLNKIKESGDVDYFRNNFTRVPVLRDYMKYTNLIDDGFYQSKHYTNLEQILNGLDWHSKEWIKKFESGDLTGSGGEYIMGLEDRGMDWN